MKTVAVMFLILGVFLIAGTGKCFLDLSRPGIYPPKMIIKKRASALAGGGACCLLTAILLFYFS